MKRLLIVPTILTVSLSAPANAIDVDFIGEVVNNCTLSIDTDGALGYEGGDGTTLSSELGSGNAAVLIVSALGAGPTLTFGAPSATEPNGQAVGSVPNIRYTSLLGASQAYTGLETTSTAGLADIYTVNGRLQNDDGFVAGTYTVTTQVTCGYA